MQHISSASWCEGMAQLSMLTELKSHVILVHLLTEIINPLAFVFLGKVQEGGVWRREERQ